MPKGGDGMPARKKEPEDLTAKKNLALEVIDRLKKEYPDAGCTLDYDHAWQLLVSVRLAGSKLFPKDKVAAEDWTYVTEKCKEALAYIAEARK